MKTEGRTVRSILILGVILTAGLATGIQAGGMEEKESKMMEMKKESMPDKAGSMGPDEGLKMTEEAMKEGRHGMGTKTRNGTLHGSKGHSAAGNAVVTAGEMGPVLVLENIEVDRVPDGRVFLALDADHRNGVELGRLEQFQGTVTFPIPADVNPADFNSVVIWCQKFEVEIGRATLAREKM